MEKQKLLEIEEIIKVKFNNIKNLEKAFIHSSYANHYGKKSNERLEYLGDSILNFITSDYLYNFTSMNEGDLSKIRAKLVGKENLSRVINKMGLQKYIMYYPEQIKSFSKKELCDLFESVIATIYIDSGLESAKQFIYRFVPLNAKTISSINEQLRDYKSTLQELLQEKHILPEYKLLKETGPNHAMLFEMGVYVEKMLVAVGVGESKKVAENNAAQKALTILKQ